MSVRGSLKICLILITLTSLCLMIQPAWGQYSGGSGTPDDPWQISCPNDLLYLGSHTEDYNSCFILTADINLADYTFSTAVIAPIDTTYGYALYPFTGTFDGNNFVIRNFTIDSNNLTVYGLGLFGSAGGSEIKNLGIENFYIIGGDNSLYIAGLAACNTGTISKCYANGTIIGREGLFALGGIAGWNEGGVIDKCNSNISVEVGYFSGFVGGITGENIYGTVSNSYATSIIQSGDMSTGIGGLAGGNEYSTIRNCYASALITTGFQSDSIGGLVGGSSEGVISNSYADCNIKCNDRSSGIGGLAGSSSSSGEEIISSSYANGIVIVGDSSQYFGGMVGIFGGEIINCYTTCDVISGINCLNIGGFAGGNYGIINNCYAAGTIADGNESSNLGGFAGKNSQLKISNCFWDIQTSGITNGVGYIESGTITNLLGKTTAEMQTQSTFTDYGWDFVNEETNGYKDDWCMPWDPGYPLLKWQLYNLYSGGDGSEGNPWQIAEPNDLLFLSGHTSDYDAHFILTNDIDLSGYTFSKAVIAPYTSDSEGFVRKNFLGTFNGNGFVIQNLKIDTNNIGNDYLGLFAKTGADSNIRNLGIDNINIIGGSGSRYLGGLVGQSYGDISNCYTTGSLESGAFIGGLFGEIRFGTITNCYSRCNIIGGDGSSYIGGLAGRNYQAIINKCYSSGIITGSSRVGGLAGSNYRSGMIIDCFWDIQTSGQANCVGYDDGGKIENVFGKTTHEMQQQETFAGPPTYWDFTTPVWVMWDGHEYPWLAWEREPVMVESISIVDKERIGRTMFRYLCKITLWNTRSQDFSNVSAELIEVPTNVSVLDGVAGCSYIEAHTTAETDDTFQIEVDRSVIINPANMVWSITYELADGSLQQSLYINNFDFLPSIMSGDITGDRITNAEDLAVLANQWLQPPGNPSADIAPEPQGDGFVNFLDLAVLANEWLRH